MSVFGDRTSEDTSKLRWDHEDGPNPISLIRIGVLIGGNLNTQRDTRVVLPQRKTVCGYSRKAAILKPRREDSRETKPVTHCWCCTLQHQICTSILQNCEKINFCCLYHPLCGILWQPKPAKTSPPSRDFLGVFGPQPPLFTKFCISQCFYLQRSKCSR